MSKTRQRSNHAGLMLGYETTRPVRGDERFMAEARATARCHHENIVVIHEVSDGEQEGQPYMVLEGHRAS